MKHTIIRRSDAETQRTLANTQPRVGVWPVATLAGLILLAICPPPTWARVSNATGTLEGRPPTATGALNVMFPGGTTAVTNNVGVSTTLKPADFGVSASALTLQDLDGDTGLSSSLDAAAVTWVWKYNNVALTAAQLAAPFSTYFLGKTVTVSASVPVTVSSLTGSPKTLGPQPLSSATYSLVVPAVAPVVRVNGASFALDSGFPKTGFSQAQFQFWMNGTSAAGNSNYTFTLANPVPWVTVNATTGVVQFTGVPAAAETVNITITDNRDGGITTFPFNIKTWFINNGSVSGPSVDADSYCASQPGYATPSYKQMTNATYGNGGTRLPDGTLWPEWGNLTAAAYSGSGWRLNVYWASDIIAVNRTVVYLDVGYLNSGTAEYYTVCSKSL